MEIEKQVTSLSLAKRMEELGFYQCSLWYWHGKDDLNETFWEIGEKFEGFPEVDYCYSAYTVAELGEMLPCEMRMFKKMYSSEGSIEYRLKYEYDKNYKTIWDDNEADARAKMLIYIKENGLIN